jgi:cell division protein FtsI (penicillin-binding protein 3)
MYAKQTFNTVQAKRDSSLYNYAGMKNDVQQVFSKLKMKTNNVDARGDEFVNVVANNTSVSLDKKYMNGSSMPQLRGMGLKDAVIACENIGLKVNVKGKGKVSIQSILAGQNIAKGQLVNIELN